TRWKRTGFFLAADGILIGLSAMLAFLFLSPYVFMPLRTAFPFLLIMFGLYSFCSFFWGICTSLFRYTGLGEMIKIFAAIFASAALSFIAVQVLPGEQSVRFAVLVALFSLLAISAEHVLVRLYFERQKKQEKEHTPQTKKRILLVGAGEAGRVFVQQLHKNNVFIEIAGIVDDDPLLHGRRLFGIPVLGSTNEIAKIAKARDVDQITVAIPSLRPQELEQIVSLCKETEIPVNLMPSIEDVMKGKLSVQKFREIDVVDLLGREEITLDTEPIKAALKGKTILISGAGGSIGSEITRIISSFQPRQ